ncbi:hypothetical protein OEZ85_012427 [Tetradesmus obliquus]|uniref:SAC domain-containing protein n=1 Tax=Tetradesmus obliquus TaxID=3088 RepID=A0ABY8TVT2_TETOB|nr:hypothetical protein OEZ85_012427 [Tetradesmus obliquus]
MASAAVDKRIESYRRISIYGTKSRLYVVGHDEQLGICRILKFRRHDGPRLDVVEDPLVYTPEQCTLVLRRVHEQSGGLQLISKGHGIIGCFRFTDSYYLLVVARREYVGHICGHKVYRIAETCLISLSASQQRIDMAAADSTAEKRYRKLLLGVDLTKNFFFSYSYSLAHTLQHNHQQAAAGAGHAAAAAAADPNSSSSSSSSTAHVAAADAAAAAAAAVGWDVYDSSMFVWNAYLTRPLRVAIQSGRWTLPLVHGYWEQRQVSVFGRALTLTLLARRSRHFAGTRFRKRGLSSAGFVANEVESEQIVDAGIDWATGQPLWSAMVQVRGSVPLFWSQQTTALSPKPDILLQQFDPVYEKTAAHFADMRRRYGDPIMALNLLRSKERRPREVRREYAVAVDLTNAGLLQQQPSKHNMRPCCLPSIQAGRARPREVLLRREYAVAVDLINAGLPQQQHIVYIPWDFSKHAKQPGANILLELAPIMRLCLDNSGIYVHGPASCSSCQAAIQARLGSRSHPAAAAAAAADPGKESGTSTKQQATPCHHSSSAAAAAPGSLQQQQQQQHQPGSADVLTASQQQPQSLAGFPKQRHFAPTTKLQRGVLRTNCIDCLDRTNVAQFAYGLAAFGAQLEALGALGEEEGGVDSDSSIALQLMEMYEGMGHTVALQLAALGVLGEEAGGVDSDSSIALQLMEMYEGMGHTVALQLAALGVLREEEGGVDSDSSIALQLMEMYEGMGHTVALQYGGSEAHAAFFQKKRGEWEATTQSRDLMTSIRRFYSNAYTDAEKQDAINLFLGNFVPSPAAPPLWELSDDYYLHSDAAIRYSQLLPAPAAAAAAPPPAGSTMTAGGRNAPPVRMISQPHKPPLAIGPQGPVRASPARLDATLDELMWSQFGISVSSQQQQQRLSVSTAPPSSSQASGLGFPGAQPHSPANAEDVGMAPEVQALWWGLGDMYEVWAVAQQGSSEAYARYCRALQQLLDEGSCSQLQSWYDQQQFRLPVVIGAV